MRQTRRFLLRKFRWGIGGEAQHNPQTPMLDGRCENAQVGGVLPWDEARSDG